MLRDSPAEFSEPVIIDPVELKVGYISDSQRFPLKTFKIKYELEVHMLMKTDNFHLWFL